MYVITYILHVEFSYMFSYMYMYVSVSSFASSHLSGPAAWIRDAFTLRLKSQIAAAAVPPRDAIDN